MYININPGSRPGWGGHKMDNNYLRLPTRRLALWPSTIGALLIYKYIYICFFFVRLIVAGTWGFFFFFFWALCVRSRRAPDNSVGSGERASAMGC
jgi:hypothetical protein